MDGGGAGFDEYSATASQWPSRLTLMSLTCMSLGNDQRIAPEAASMTARLFEVAEPSPLPPAAIHWLPGPHEMTFTPNGNGVELTSPPGVLMAGPLLTWSIRPASRAGSRHAPAQPV